MIASIDVAYFPDLGTVSQIASGPHVRAVGWLSVDKAYPKAEPAPELIARLEQVRVRASDSIMALCWPAAGGYHECEFCGRDRESRNFGLPSGTILYVCPAMIDHYVRAHSYAPPVEFVDAVLTAPLVGTLEYDLAVAPFNTVLQTKHQDIQAVVCILRAQLGRAELLAYPSIQDGPAAIWLGDYNGDKPQARVRIETSAVADCFEVQLGHGPFHHQDRFELERTFHGMTLPELASLIRREFAPWVNSDLS